MDRLVLGESEPHPIAPPPRIITGSDISVPPPPMASHSELKFRKKYIFVGRKTHFFDIFKSTKTHFLLFQKWGKNPFLY